MNPRYSANTVYLDLPKRRKAQKCVTSRIITIEAVKEMIRRINAEESNGEISSERTIKYRAVITTGAFTGQRIEATMSTLTTEEFRKALDMDIPCLSVLSDKDKIKMAHYVPLHPNTIETLKD